MLILFTDKCKVHTYLKQQSAILNEKRSKISKIATTAEIQKFNLINQLKSLGTNRMQYLKE
jgi:hypothetical protein